jgi:hypothetical protein
MKYLTKEVMDKWIAALRSGQYNQGRGKLKSSNGYCCLGVLCDVLPSEAGVWSSQVIVYPRFEFHGFVFTSFGAYPGRESNDVYLNGEVELEFNQLFGQPAVRKVFLDHLQTTPWKSVDLKDADSYQSELAILNDLVVDPDEVVHNNPDNLAPLPFTVLADWLEAALTVADFSS